MKRHSTGERRAVGRHLRGILKANRMRQLRETVYRMIAKRNNGKVPCFVCKHHVARTRATLEHVIPRSRGGTDAYDNLSISHPICNHRHGAPEVTT